MKFSKYQGLGNDFIIVERPEIDGMSVSDICNRRTGVGADGILLITPNEQSSFDMKVYNADGSVPEMCGNGLRCAAAYLRDTDQAPADSFLMGTGAGPIRVRYSDAHVTADMGQVMHRPPQVVALPERQFAGQYISTGNPHFVIFEALSADEHRKFGPLLCHHDAFPVGANISFAVVHNRQEVELVVWERGCGLTQACGTGACATTVSGWLQGHLAPSEVSVCLPGGRLMISGTPDNVVMTGPAVHVFDGVLST